MIKLSFHGGAREVTGACYLLDTGKTKILVDCGLFQGCDECSGLNFGEFGFDPAEIDFVLVTHSHLDHIGRLPKLVREGFAGKIYSTSPTREIAALILEDAFGLMEGREGFNRGRGGPLYEKKDLEKTFEAWETLPYYQMHEKGGVRFMLKSAGHILGSAMIDFFVGEKRIFFTGDLGNAPSVLIPPPDVSKGFEYLVIESTYGNRQHEPAGERSLKLERAVEDAFSGGGTLMIPAFATERTQDVLYLLNEMLLYNRVPQVPVFVDSPLAIRITAVYEKYFGHYKEEVRDLFRDHPNLFKNKKLRFTETAEESKRINDVSPPKVVLAGSGMMSGGRILHHAKRYLGDPRSLLLLTGYQSPGSLGRRLFDGEKTVKIFGEEIPVRCGVRCISGFSAHADNPQLFSFVEGAKDDLKKVFVVQGEEGESLHFSQEIKDRLGVQAAVPVLHQEFEL